MHPIMDDVCSYNKSDAGDKHIKHPLSCRNGYSTVRCKVGDPANEQFDEWDKNSRQTLEQSIIEQEAGILIYENLAFPYIGKHAAQKPESKYGRDCLGGIHTRKSDLDDQINLVIIICPYMNIIARMNRHTAGVPAMILLCVNCVFKGSRFCMQEKSLPSHKTEDRT